jgi:DNA-binding transcriptional MerR regulator/methanogenic corrinoid protein MtbC1
VTVLGVRIGELSRRVGVPPETLRAWERRYGVLRPERTTAGYRVYGRADQQRARRMRELIAGGWAAGEAAHAVATEQPGPSAAPSEPAADAADASADLIAAARGAHEVAGEDRDGAGSTGDPGADGEEDPAASPDADAAELLAGLLRYDSAAANGTFDRVLAVRSLDCALRDVVLPVMRAIGFAWERSESSITQEHFATELVTGRLRGLARDWDTGLGPRAVLACPSGERHDIGLLCCGLALHRRGWRVTYLGPDTPTSALAGTVTALGPVVVVLCVLRPGPLAEAAPGLAEVAARVPIAVGGAGSSPPLAAEAGARHLECDPVTAAAELTSVI